MRARIARAGYERTIRDHTWRRRLEDVFAAIGVATEAPAEVVDDDDLSLR